MRSRGLDLRRAWPSVAENELQPSRRLAAADDAARDWALLSRIDPSNMITKGNLISHAHDCERERLWDLGRPRDSPGQVSGEPRVGVRCRGIDAGRRPAFLSLYWAAIVAAELGQAATADNTLPTRCATSRSPFAHVPPGTFEHGYWRAFGKRQPG